MHSAKNCVRTPLFTWTTKTVPDTTPEGKPTTTEVRTCTMRQPRPVKCRTIQRKRVKELVPARMGRPAQKPRVLVVNKLSAAAVRAAVSAAAARAAAVLKKTPEELYKALPCAGRIRSK